MKVSPHKSALGAFVILDYGNGSSRAFRPAEAERLAQACDETAVALGWEEFGRLADDLRRTAKEIRT